MHKLVDQCNDSEPSAEYNTVILSGWTVLDGGKHQLGILEGNRGVSKLYDLVGTQQVRSLPSELESDVGSDVVDVPASVSTGGVGAGVSKAGRRANIFFLRGEAIFSAIDSWLRP